MVYTILDIESTGLSRDFDEILTVGFIRVNSQLEILSSGTLYFYKEGFNVGKYPACTVHRLTEAMMRPHAGEFKDNLKKLYSLCYMGSIIGKNSTNFDIPMICSFVGRHSKSLSDLECARTLDIQSLVAPVYQAWSGTSKKGKLGDYVTMYGITNEELREIYNSLPVKDGASMHLHGALYDAVATYAVLKRYIQQTGYRI